MILHILHPSMKNSNASNITLLYQQPELYEYLQLRRWYCKLCTFYKICNFQQVPYL